MKKSYTDVLLEDMNSKFETIMEVLMPMKENVDLIPEMRQDITNIKAEITTIKSALTATNHNVANHETRITRLETKTA